MKLSDASLDPRVTRWDPLIPTVFHNHWWLDAATDGTYQETELRAGGRTVARFPYVISRTFVGQRVCAMPELTHFLGPAIDCGDGSAANRRLRHFQITRDLLDRLPAFSGFWQKLHRGTPDTLAFGEAGYTTLVEFTYEIAPCPEQAIWRGMRDKTRNVIRRAEERWQVTTMDDPDAFTAFYEATIRRRGLINHYTRIAQVCAAAMTRHQGRILAVRDGKGATLGAIFTAWDQRTAYHLLASRVPNCDNGVMSLLVWNAIRDAVANGLLFDFDGLGPSGNRLFYTGFGGHVMPRYIVARHDIRYRMTRRVSALLTSRRRRAGPDV